MNSVTVIEQVPHGDYSKLELTSDRLLWIMRKMVEIRKFEEKVEELFLLKGLLIGPSHLYLGQEAIAAGSVAALNADDMTVTTYRGHGHALAKSVPMREVMAELFGKATGNCKGLGGSMHVAISPKTGSMYATAIVGSGIPISGGLALAQQLLHTGKIVVSYFGDGAVNTGAFHEGTNLAALWKLPVVLLCENNHYAMSTRVDRAVAGPGIAERGLAYGIPSYRVDGNDPVAVFLATKEASERARKGSGPTLLECVTYKQKGHGVYDKAEYRPKTEVEEWLRRDPIINFKNSLKASGLLTEPEFEIMQQEVAHDVEEATKFAIESPLLRLDELSKFVYA
jgi:TPP-dependent pyruvate/acetoin dehydrogenase alpha subunit